ncbi:MAG TPA: hypothetical protein VGH87_23865 [Polyangiaceae bacterium]|jgi:hypothetical protein
MVRLLALFVLTGVQCGLDEGGVFEGDAATNDVVVASDGGGSDVVQTQDALPDVPAPPVEAGICDEDADYCQAPNVPTGWSPVAYAESPATNCPTADWPTQSDWVANVQNGNAACGCGCAKTGDPNCATGKIDTFFSQSSNCTNQGTSLSFIDGGCTAVGGGNLGNYYASSTIAPSGSGSCTSQAAATGSLATTPARTCAPDSTCTSATCAGVVPSGWQACIIADGDQPCPTGSVFAQKHAIAKSVTFDCAQTCTCNVSGTCDSPKVNFYSQGGCNNGLIVTLPSDTTCNATNNNGTSVAAASYTATPNFKCNSNGTSAVQREPTTPTTVCCR